MADVLKALHFETKSAEACLAARRQARAEARRMRMKELEKQQKESDEASDRHYELFGNNGTTGLTSSAVKTAVTARDSRSSYSGSRRSSEDSLDVAITDARDYRHQMHDLEDKFRTAMITNAQLDNEKQSLSYQVELYKDDIEEFEENFIRLNKDYKDKSRTFDQLNRDFKKLQKDCDYYRECVKQRDYLIEEAGLVLIDSECNHVNGINGDISDKRSESFGDESGDESGISGSATISKALPNASLITQEAAQLLTGVDGHSLEAKIKTLLAERKTFVNDINHLRTELDEERQRSTKLEELTLAQSQNSSSGLDSKDIQREANRLVSDYKVKIKKYEQDISFLNTNVMRLETQLTRYRTASEEAERIEDELKAEKRKTQRELREALARVEELETANAHLQKRIDKLKSNRNIVTTNSNSK